MFKTKKSVQVVRFGNPCHRLTITPKQITVKIKDPCSSEEEAKVTALFSKISESFENSTVAYRGALKLKDFTITMWDDHKTSSRHFNLDGHEQNK